MDSPASDSAATALRIRAAKQQNIVRAPLLPSEKNSTATGGPAMRKATAREVSSRYKSISDITVSQASSKLNPGTVPKRYASPVTGRGRRTDSLTGSSVPKRAQSAERRRPAAPLPSSPSCSSCSSSSSSGPVTPMGVTDLDMRTASGHLMWPSMRRLSTAFQSEPVSVPTNNTISMDQSRKKTPLKARRSITDQLAKRHDTVSAKLSDKGVLARPVKDLPSQLPATRKGSLSPIRTRLTPVQSAFPSAVPRQGKQLRGKQVEDAHQLRINCNKLLQWRFMNARGVDALSAQKEVAEGTLYGVWNNISSMRDSIINKRMHLQQQLQKEKLQFVLNDQIAYLEQWDLLESQHTTSLSGSIGALKASTLRLPVTAGAKADLHAVKNAVSSAIDVMQSMGSSVCSLLDKVEVTRSSVLELATVAAQEKAMLQEYRDLQSTAAQLQVQESSLQTQLIQLRS